MAPHPPSARAMREGQTSIRGQASIRKASMLATITQLERDKESRAYELINLRVSVAGRGEGCCCARIAENIRPCSPQTMVLKLEREKEEALEKAEALSQEVQACKEASAPTRMR